MKTAAKQLAIEQLDRKFAKIKVMRSIAPPEGGWVRTVRLAIGMSLRQLAERLHISTSSVREIEQREESGSITLRSLSEAAEALDMYLVYALLPKDGALGKMVEKRAAEVASSIVLRTATTMELEGQEISARRMKNAIEEKKKELLISLPRQLWD
ncbi:MAG: mobile mystery protein A [Bacteroidetes bacterium]|nr:mobile mystery protein A [Bacteroidota bacterium]